MHIFFFPFILHPLTYLMDYDFNEQVRHGETLLQVKEANIGPDAAAVSGPVALGPVNANGVAASAATAIAAEDGMPALLDSNNSSGSVGSGSSSSAGGVTVLSEAALADMDPEARVEALAAVQAEAEFVEATKKVVEGGGESSSSSSSSVPLWAPSPFLTRNVLQVKAVTMI
jgi:hypothetical protein